MRKFFVEMMLLVSLITLSSCSDNTSDIPDTAADVISFRVDGIQKAFTTVQVTESTFIEGELDVPTYNVLATPEEDNGEYVAFQMERDFTGTGGLYAFIYSDAEGSTHSITDNFTFTVTVNTANKLAGSFSGPLFLQEIEPSLTISEGSFNINN